MLLMEQASRYTPTRSRWRRPCLVWVSSRFVSTRWGTPASRLPGRRMPSGTMRSSPAPGGCGERHPGRAARAPAADRVAHSVAPTHPRGAAVMKLYSWAVAQLPPAGPCRRRTCRCCRRPPRSGWCRRLQPILNSTAEDPSSVFDVAQQIAGLVSSRQSACSVEKRRLLRDLSSAAEFAGSSPHSADRSRMDVRPPVPPVRWGGPSGPLTNTDTVPSPSASQRATA